MTTTNDTFFKPSWYDEKTHGSAWSRVKAAMQRDWEQTKNDFTPGAPDLNQDVGDTVKQAAGKEPIPAPGVQTPPSKLEMKKDAKKAWSDVESPISYGYAAKTHYGKTYPQWNDELEGELQKEWNRGTAGGKIRQKWEDIKDAVRHGFSSTV